MKTKLSIIFFALLTVATLLLSVSCGGDQHVNDEDHDWQEKSHVDPSCTAAGRITYFCECGEEKTDVIDPIGAHEAGSEVDRVNSTCVTAGYVTYVCSRCSEEYTETLEISQHTSVAYESKAATCVEDGSEGGSYCSVCETVLEEPTVVTATGVHTPADYETVEATCGEKGYTGGTYCSVCEAHLTDRVETEPTGEHTEEAIYAVEPTCTSLGYTEGVRCSVCESVLVSPEEIPMTEHDYSYVVTTPPAFQVVGVGTYTCNDCGDSYTDEIPALTYSPDDVWDGSKASSYASGTGTEADPYVIETAEQFYFFYYELGSSNTYENVYVKLAKDIVLNDLVNYDKWSTQAPANTRLYPMCQIGFKGHFDGCGYAIRGWYSSGNDAGGLFSKIDGGSVKNVRMTEAYINNTASSSTVGGVVNRVSPHNATVVISGCEFDGIIRSKNTIGGIIGGTSLGSYGHTSVTTRRDTYGNLTVSDCKTYGKFTNTGTRYDQYTYVGGIFGQVKYTYTTLSVTNCTNYATINSCGTAGGISGSFTNSDGSSYRLNVTLSGLRNEGKVTALADAAGISPSASIISDYKDENVNTLYISDCSNIGEIISDGNTSSSSSAAGLFGRVSASGSSSYYTRTSYVMNCYNLGNVTHNGNAYNVAGLIGGLSLESLDSYLKNCFNAGDVVALNASNVGGLFAYVGSNNYHSAEIDSCYNSGNVTGKQNVGGIAGYEGGCHYTNVYNTGDITAVGVTSSETVNGGKYVGGIFGRFESGGSLTNAFNLGNVKGDQNYVGAIVGSQKKNASSIYNAYYLEGCAVDGEDTQHGIYGNEYYAENLNSAATLTADNVSVQSTYKNFDFTKNWNAPSGEEGSHPTLKNVVTLPTEEETPEE